jgi:hypothetical protein
MYLTQCRVIPAAAKRRAGIHGPRTELWVPDSGCAASGTTRINQLTASAYIFSTCSQLTRFSMNALR